MSSFAGLKAARASRQRPLAIRTLDTTATAKTGHSEAEAEEGRQAVVDDVPRAEEPEYIKASLDRDSLAVESNMSIATLGEPSMPVTGLPSYADFPSERLEVRRTKTRGRGMYVRQGITVKRGESVIRTNPPAASLSRGQLANRCARCWLDGRELSIVRSMMHEYSNEPRGKKTQIQSQFQDKPDEDEGILKRCTRCKVVRYCSTECQTVDWPTHQPECRALKRLRRVSRHSTPKPSPETSIEDQERRILKAMNGQADDVGEDDGEGSVPGWIPPEEVMVLGRVVWGRRKAKEVGPAEEGRYVSIYRLSDETRRIRLSIEFGIWLWVVLPTLFESSVVSIADMQSHRPDLDTLQREPFARLALRLNQYLSAAEPLKQGEKEQELVPVDMSKYGFRDVPEMLDLCTAFGSNSFTLSSSALEPIGTVVSPLLALLNHSCEPNAVVVFPNGGAANDGKGMELVALCDIKEGEEILTCYVDVASPIHTRRKELEETYHFDCTCALCSVTSAGKVDPRWALRHFECGGAVGMPDLNQQGNANVRCKACESSYTVNVDRIKSLVEFSEQILEEEAHGFLGDFHASKVPSITDAMAEYFLPSSYPFLPLLRLRSLLATRPTLTSPGQPGSETVHDLFEGIEVQALVWKGMKMVYPDGHPSLGIALTELGKLLNLDATEDSVRRAYEPQAKEVGKTLPLPVQATDRLGLARETLGMALAQLRVGFGRTGGLVGREVEGIMEGLTSEMKFKGLIA